MACPHCWHHCPHQPDAGIATYNINCLITHVGGTLVQGTCNRCQWNIHKLRQCTDCTSLPCPQHVAILYNGNRTVSPDILQLYLRNSPYKSSWSERPSSIGRWYAQQATKYSDAVAIVRRFTDNWQAVSELNMLEQLLKSSVCIYDDFWSGFIRICKRYFASRDAVSCSVSSFYSALMQRNLKY